MLQLSNRCWHFSSRLLVWEGNTNTTPNNCLCESNLRNPYFYPSIRKNLLFFNPDCTLLCFIFSGQSLPKDDLWFYVLAQPNRGQLYLSGGKDLGQWLLYWPQCFRFESCLVLFTLLFCACCVFFLTGLLLQNLIILKDHVNCRASNKENKILGLSV